MQATSCFMDQNIDKTFCHSLSIAVGIVRKYPLGAEIWYPELGCYIPVDIIKTACAKDLSILWQSNYKIEYSKRNQTSIIKWLLFG